MYFKTYIEYYMLTEIKYTENNIPNIKKNIKIVSRSLFLKKIKLKILNKELKFNSIFYNI